MIDAIQITALVGALCLLASDSHFAWGAGLALVFVALVVDAWRR